MYHLRTSYSSLQEKKKLREAVPDNDIASLQEELAAAKLREAEANLALKDLKTKVAELSAMWKKHLQQRSESESESASAVVPSTPKKLLGSLLENGKSEVARLEEELMTARLIEVESQAELKDTRLKIMELETQVCRNKVMDLGSHDSGFGFYICHGVIMGWAWVQLEGRYISFNIFAIFDDFMK